jgi:hypothetical protein
VSTIRLCDYEIVDRDNWGAILRRAIHTAPSTALLYPQNKFKKDPGNQPSLTACVRYTWNNGWGAI